ncbi:hypothetical protein [Dyadobacter tibetensis]|nr:hypothetical protein [Dyadobacter tibetensis]
MTQSDTIYETDVISLILKSINPPIFNHRSLDGIEINSRESEEGKPGT